MCSSVQLWFPTVFQCWPITYLAPKALAELEGAPWTSLQMASFCWSIPAWNFCWNMNMKPIRDTEIIYVYCIIMCINIYIYIHNINIYDLSQFKSMSFQPGSARLEGNPNLDRVTASQVGTACASCIPGCKCLTTKSYLGVVTVYLIYNIYIYVYIYIHIHICKWVK